MKGDTMYLRRFLFSLIACFALGPPLIAQQIVTGTITGSSCVQIDVTGKGVASISVTNSATGSAWTGTIQPQVAIGGDPAQNTSVYPTGSTTAQSTITANNVYQSVSVSGATLFQVCGNTVTNTANIKLTAVSLSGRNGGGGGGSGSGTVSPGTAPDLAVYTGSTTVGPSACTNVSNSITCPGTLQLTSPFGALPSTPGASLSALTFDSLGQLNQSANNAAYSPFLTVSNFPTLVGSAWTSLTNGSGNLNISPGGTSTLNTTSPVTDFLSLRNITVATGGTSQSSPIFSLCGTSFTTISVTDCIALQYVMGAGANAPNTLNFFKELGGTGIVTSTFPGPVASGSDGVHSAYLSLLGNTTAPTITANTAGWLGPPSASFTGYACSFPATAPSGGQVLSCGTPTSGVSVGSWVSAGGTTTNALTMNNGGTGAASGSTFNGSAAITLSYNTIGAAPTVSPTFTGTVTTPLSTAGLVTTTSGGVLGSEATVSVAQGGTGLATFPADTVWGNPTAVSAAPVATTNPVINTATALT